MSEANADSTGGAGGGVSGDGAAGVDGVAGGGVADSQGAPPDWLPEKFRVMDGDRFNPDASYEKALNSYADLEKTLSAGKEKLREEVAAELEAKRAESVPEAYEVRLPKAEDIGAPDGLELSLPDDDPLLGFWRETAKEIGLTQEQFDRGVQEFIKVQVASLPDVAAEKAKLGEDADGRIERLERKIAANVPNEVYQSLVSTLKIDAGLVQALEHITDKLEDPGPGAFEGSKQDAISREDVLAMMEDPRYLDNDREWHAKVAAAWRVVAGTNPVPNANRSSVLKDS